MREDTLASRTERVGRMLVDDGRTSAGDLDWVRWRLAVSLNKHWYKSSGASARAFQVGASQGIKDAGRMP